MNPGGDAQAGPQRRLPLHQILVAAFTLPWRHRAAVARVVGLPLLAVIASTLFFNLGLPNSGAARWTLYLLYLLATSWLALSVHRLVLLESGDARARLDADGLGRLGRFVAALVVIWLVYAAIMLLVQLAALFTLAPSIPAGQRPAAVASFPAWVQWTASILAIWPAARLCLVLPAAAVDRSFDPRIAWRLSRGNGWRLAVIIGVLPWALKWLAHLFYRQGATLVEFGVLLVLVASFTVFQVVALSLAYWELTQPAPPPTDPLA